MLSYYKKFGSVFLTLAGFPSDSVNLQAVESAFSYLRKEYAEKGFYTYREIDTYLYKC